MDVFRTARVKSASDRYKHSELLFCRGEVSHPHEESVCERFDDGRDVTADRSFAGVYECVGGSG